MHISSAADHTEQSHVTSVDIIYNNNLNILHSVETLVANKMISCFKHRTACMPDSLDSVAHSIPGWLETLTAGLPDEEVPPAEGNYIISSTEIFTINVGSSVVWMQKSALSYTDGEIKRSSRHENQPLELLCDVDTGVLTWIDDVKVDERSTDIIKLIPPEVLGFVLEEDT